MWWLDDQRGYLSDWLTQVWVKATGRPFADQYPQLIGPVGQRRRIGYDQPEELARELGLTLTSPPDAGLLRGTAQLFPGIHPSVARFYDHTSRYDLQVWSEWSGPFRPFGWLLGLLFSRRLEQMNVPLAGLDTAWGMHSQVAELQNRAGHTEFTVWRRTLRRTGRVLFVGYYSEVVLEGGPGVRVVFPLPGGNIIVLMSAQVEVDGRLTLRSYGSHFGGPGAYFTLGGPEHPQRIGRLIPMHEQLQVWADGPVDLRASHTLNLWRWKFLELHYLMREKPDQAAPDAR